MLLPVLRALRDDPRFSLQLVLTGQHLMTEAGGTGSRIRDGEFMVNAEVDMGLDCDDGAPALIKGAGRLLDGMADIFARLAPDLALVLGDRYEIAATAIAATIARVPLVHIAGGDVTTGAFDDAFRHAISKMSHIHFVTNDQSAQRLRQMGEQPERVHVVGSPGLDLIATTALPSREQFFADVGLVAKPINLVITFHPETLAADTLGTLDAMLSALDQLGPDVAILFTGSNADPDARQVEARIKNFIGSNASRRFLNSLGAERYFAALAYMDAVVGNSSSGLYEAPSFGIPTVNIGDRQTGRLKAASVIDSKADPDSIFEAINAALARGRQPTSNPYGDGRAVQRIVDQLARISDPRALLNKKFIEIKAA